MPKRHQQLPPVSDLFAQPPEKVAQRVTAEWHAEHPEWTAEELKATHAFLLDVYRQAWAWWRHHPKATHARVRQIYDEIVRAYLRGEHLIEPPGVARVRHDRRRPRRGSGPSSRRQH